MKAELVAFLVLYLTSQLALAQKFTSADEMATYQDEVFQRELNLNEQQMEVVSSINLKYAQKQMNLMKQEGSMLGKMGDMKKMAKAKNEELEKNLTKEQFNKYEKEVAPALRKEIRNRMRSQ
ncbi:MAG: hypothetical protein AAFP76_10905 [Bacteroidota bacterium]